MSSFYVICFDVTERKRLRQVAIQLENFGQRVQYSVFECHLNANDLEILQQRLADIIDPKEDHIRYYNLCNKDIPKILLDGQGTLTPNNNYHLL